MLFNAYTVLFFLLGAVQVINACPDGGMLSNPACCVLLPVLGDIQSNLFGGGKCENNAHKSIRIAFHDAIGYSPALSTSGQFGGGGADGSIITFDTIETTYAANNGLSGFLAKQKQFVKRHNMSAGDFIQFAGAVGLSNCPGAPQLNFMLGRPPASAAAPDGLIPAPFDNVDKILNRFADAGFIPAEVVALLASHSVAGADVTDTTIPGTPLDSSPSVFDTQFFVETQLRGTLFPGTSGNRGEAKSRINGEIRIQSDNDLARDPRTSCEWQSFVNNQDKLQSAFKTAMAKLSTLGQDMSKLVDCSDVIPVPKPFKGAAVFPPTLTKTDVDQACKDTLFPELETQPGSPITLKPIPP